MAKMETAEDHYRPPARSRTDWSNVPEAELAPRLFWQAELSPKFDRGLAGQALAINVYVNHGRWIAECPDCHGAQVASRVDRRFMCHCCGNVLIQQRWRRVIWPARPEEIEEALAERPVSATRNWRPGESIADLARENLDRGGAP